jgi:hypothetical protein
MLLIDLEVPSWNGPIPSDVKSLLREADRRIEEFQTQHCIPGFVAGDYPHSYRTIRALSESDLLTGHSFCEWGSGFGVVTCLAAMIGFEASGIEVEDDLVKEAVQLADDFDVNAYFVRGSYLPAGAEQFLDSSKQYGWLSTDCENTSDELGLGPSDFDVIFAFPWPDEETVVARVFERFAADNALLLTIDSNSRMRLRQKSPARRFR